MEELGDAQIPNDPHDVLFFVQLSARLIKSLVREPLLPIIGPSAKEESLTAAATLCCARHQAIATVTKPKVSSFVDTLDHLFIIVSHLAIFLFWLKVIKLEIDLLKHALIEYEPLVVAYKQGEEPSYNLRVAAQISQNARESLLHPDILELLLVLT